MVVGGDVVIDCADKLAFGCLLSTESGCVLLDATALLIILVAT